MRLSIKTSDVVVATGQRGTGKSFAVDELAKAFGAHVPLYCYDPLDQHKGIRFARRVVGTYESQSADFDALCKLSYASGNNHLFAEEANLFFRDGMEYHVPHAWESVSRGRNRGVGMTLITQRVAELSKVVVGRADHMLIFRHSWGADVHTLAKMLGDDAASVREWREKIKTVPDHHFYWLHDGKVEGPIKL